MNDFLKFATSRGMNSMHVENVEMAKPSVRKALINQSLYLIMPNGDMYDVSGRLVR